MFYGYSYIWRILNYLHAFMYTHPLFKVHKDLRLIRFLPAPTGRNVLDFNQNSLHLDACMPLAHFAELLARWVGAWHVLFCRFQLTPKSSLCLGNIWQFTTEVSITNIPLLYRMRRYSGRSIPQSSPQPRFC